MPMQRQDEGTEVDLQELQRRFRVLEGDRKAYYETSQMTIKQNKEILGDLRSDNKELRKTLATLQRESGAGQRAGCCAVLVLSHA